MSFQVPLVDSSFAKLVLKDQKDSAEKVLFLSFLFAASRQGYLCLEVNENTLFPPLQEVWPFDENLLKQIIAGSKELSIPGIIQEGNCFYLERNFVAKKTCFEEWQRIQNAEVFHPLDLEMFTKELSALKKTGALTDEQFHAVEKGCRFSPFILTGGPGTGKTYTAGRILKTLLSSIPKPLQIAIAAPTGKAALNIEKALSKHVEGEFCKAKTLHALLGLKGEIRPGEKTAFLPCDVLIVDEASMIDVELMALLLRSVKSGAKLILMGDPYQLAPVDGAPIFERLIDQCQEKAALSRCLRAESLELVRFASEILKKEAISSNSHVKLFDNQASIEEIIAANLSHFPRVFSKEVSPEDILNAFQVFRILTPLRRGPLGSEAINRLVLRKLEEKGLNAIPIMICANDYRLGLFNGEVGILLRSHAKGDQPFNPEDRVYFGENRSIPALLLPRYELAYAMTVHKSQGSEFDHVLLILPDAMDKISPPLLYTAVTRAKKWVTIHVMQSS